VVLGRTRGEQLRASAERCLRAIAAELGVEIDDLPSVIIAAVTTFGLECVQHVQGDADEEAATSLRPVAADDTTQVGWRRPRNWAR